MSRLNQSSAVIEPTTAAVSTTVYFTLSKSEIPARLTATNLAGSESYSLFSVDGPSDVATAVYQDGAAVTLKATAPSTGITSPGVYGLTKSATASASGAYLAKG